ncbi:MAG: hypothetical protein E7F47_04860 [Peptoniphilus harei]|nr:hypothetical protein [Peptoniphilus harei]
MKLTKGYTPVSVLTYPLDNLILTALTFPTYNVALPVNVSVGLGADATIVVSANFFPFLSYNLTVDDECSIDLIEALTLYSTTT